MRYRNVDAYAHTWTHLAGADGRLTSLSLEPGETVELDLAPDFTDPHLQPAVIALGKKHKATTAPDSAALDTEPAPAPSEES